MTPSYYQQFQSTKYYYWLPFVMAILLLLSQQSQAYSIMRNRPQQHPNTQRLQRQIPFLSLSSSLSSSQPSHGKSVVRLHAQYLSYSELGLLQQCNENIPQSSQPLSQTTKDTVVRTRRLLSTTNNDSNEIRNTEQQQQQQPWTAEQFREAQDLMTLWSYRYSRRAGLTVERIIRRVVQEQTAAILRRQQRQQSTYDDDGNDDDDDDDDDDDNNNIDDYDDDDDIDFGIDMATMYTCAIRAWANSGERGPAARRAEEILETMQQRYMDSKNDDNDNANMRKMKPGIEAFNLVLMAYARSGLPDAPQRALRVLSRLHDWYTSGETDVAPNKASYAMVLTAFAKTGKPDAPLYVKQLLEHFERMAHDEGYLSVKPDILCHSAYVTALIDAMDRDFITGEEAATEIEEYLYHLLHQDDEDARPDAYMFNMGLNAWSKAFSENAVERASALMETFEQYHEASGRTEKNRPTTVSYNFLLACCSRSISSDGVQAEKILRKMEQLEKSGCPWAGPDAVSYNTVMTAYGKSRKNAPYKCEQLLRELHDRYEQTKDERLRPTSRSISACVNAWSKSDDPIAAARIMDWIVNMANSGQKNYRPDKWTYNAYLHALSKSGDPNMAEGAEKILDQMEEYYQNGWIELKPDVLTFTSVIHCIAVSGADDAVERSLSIVRRMEDLHEQGYGDVRPNSYTYNCVINAVAKSKRRGKAQIALEVLRRMQEVALRPPTVTINNVLNACAYADHPDDDPHEILDIAESVFEDAKKTCGVNFITFATMVRVVTRCVRDAPKKRDMITDIFRQCCEAGQLTDQVMRQIKYALGTKDYEKLRAHVVDHATGKYLKKFTVNARLPPKSTLKTQVH